MLKTANLFILMSKKENLLLEEELKIKLKEKEKTMLKFNSGFLIIVFTLNLVN